MNSLALYLFVFLTYPLPIAAVYYARVPTISPLTTLVFFYLMEYGPHTLNQNWLSVAADVPDFVEQRYILAIGTANLALAAGIVFARALFRAPLGPARVAQASTTPLIRRPGMVAVLLFVALVYAIVFLVLDTMGPPRLASIIEYILGQSTLEYGDIRRVLFADTIVETVMQYTRQSTSILLLLLMAAAALRFRGLLRSVLILATFAVFVICSMQLNKFPIVYALSCVAVVVYLLKTNRYYVPRRHLVLFVVAVLLVGFGLYGLYLIQYREAMAKGLLNQDDITNLVFYRAALAQADGLRLWFYEFPDRTPFLGIANIGLLANLFDVQYFDVTRHIPTQYLKSDVTTFQAGFIGSGYASFGWGGIVGYAVACGMIGTIATVQVWRFRSSDVRAAFCAALAFNMYFLCSREFATALLSGGIGPLMILGLFAIPERRRRTGPGASYPIGESASQLTPAPAPAARAAPPAAPDPVPTTP